MNYKIGGTELQKRALVFYAVNGGSMAGAMRAAGYSAVTARNPKKLTSSSGFMLLLEQAGVTDAKLSRVLNEGLNAKRNHKPDHAIRHKFLETGLKLKGHLKKDGEPEGGNTYNNFIGNNTINPNAPTAKQIVESTLDIMMKQTKREVKA